MLITDDYKIYEMPCGDLCATTCLDQAAEIPSYEVHVKKCITTGVYRYQIRC